MTQGFQHWTELMSPNLLRFPPPPAASLEALLRKRTAERPPFVFVNLSAAHDPYLVRAGMRLPPDVDRDEAERLGRKARNFVCNTDGQERELAVLRMLYQGGVRAADAALEGVLEVLRGARLGRRPGHRGHVGSR
jgi:hypothetical protein